MLHGYNIFVWWELLRYTLFSSVQFSSVQSLSRAWLFGTPWIAACQASLSITNSQSLLKLMPIKSVMPSSHLILCLPFLLLPPVPPRIRVFSNESALLMLLLLLLSRFSRVRLCATPSLGFSRQEQWSELPFPSPMHKSEKWKWIRSVMSDSSWPHGLQPTRLLHPWDVPGKSTGVGCHCLLRLFSWATFKYTIQDY